MIKKLLTTISFLCLLLTANAQLEEFTINVQLDIFPTAEIFISPEGLPVFIASADGSIADELVTDESGMVTVTYDFQENYIYDFEVAVFDFCTGEVLIEAVNTTSGSGTADLFFLLCEDFDDPVDPINPDDCYAYYDYAQNNPDNLLEVSYFNASFSSSETMDFAWDFGDGNTSTEENPIHTYTDEGIYEVSLTINGEDCSNTMIMAICVYTEGWGGPIDCECGIEYEPVCVTFDIWNDIITYPNECWALCDGFTPEDFVECIDGDGCGCEAFFGPIICIIDDEGNLINWLNECEAQCEGYTPDQFVDCNDNDCTCTAEYDPVCIATPGFPGGGFLEFPNACEAICEGFTEDMFVDCNAEYCDPFAAPIVQDLFSGDLCGQCIASVHIAFYEGAEYIVFLADNTNCDDAMTVVYDCEGNVYCQDGGFAGFNECEAFFEGQEELFPLWTNDFCNDPGECLCDDVYDPVCITSADGETLTFLNPCFAECEGYDPALFESCDDPCGCDDVYDPVCVDILGAPLPFDNECQALCAGFTPDMIGTCNDCGCDADYDPVCVITDDGQLLSFSNPCVAECQGYDTTLFESCDDPWNCECTEEYDPVCVLFIEGFPLEYPNACFAACDGFTEEDFVDCDGDWYCYASFEYYQANPDNLLEVTFTTWSEGATSWVWDFGDGTTSNEENPVHTYTVEGIYSVSLTVATDGECTSTTVYDICIYEDGGGWPGGEDCDCTAEFLPVCGYDDTGAEVIFPNECWAICAGYDPGTLETCDEIELPCGCGPEYDPVCLTIDSTEDYWFQNPCLAACAGYEPDSYESCDNGPIDPTDECGCGIEGEPVCVMFLDVIFITFPNICYAECYGFLAEEIVECGDGSGFPTDGDITDVLDELEGSNYIGSAGFIGSNNNNIVNGNKTAKWTPELVYQLSAYPNPVVDELTLSFAGLKEMDYQLNVIALTGQQVYNKEHQMTKGANTLTLDVQDLPSGMYMVQLSSKDQVKTLKFVK